MVVQHRSGKLAVILHADIAGSTVLVQQDERLAHQRIQDTFRRFSEVISRYHGRVLELRGDALLAEFERASDAVAGSLAFQKDHTDYIAQFDDGIQPLVRVGLALGEVIIADNTITGAGVVLAQRIEQLADPGGVAIQGAAYETIPSRFPFEFTDLGEQSAKGFEKPVRVYSTKLKDASMPPEPQRIERKTQRSVSPFLIVMLAAISLSLWWFKPWQPDIEQADVERMAFALPDKPSIAVLPFTNLSQDAEQEYFVDGMTEDLITDLSKISGLFVIARNSVFSYKGRTVKIQQVAEELGVRYVLEGSVRRSGDEVRINAQLIDAISGGHLWAERYDDTLDNVFALQDKVSLKIIAALSENLGDIGQADAEREDKTETTNVDAYDVFLQGWKLYRQGRPDDLKEAIGFLEQAIELDPHYHRAYAALSAVYWRIYSNLWYEQVMGVGYSFQALEKSREYLKLAQQNPTPLAYQVSAEITAHFYDVFEFGPIEEAKKGIALDPNDPAGHIALAVALLRAGRAQEAETQVREAMRLDPLFPVSYLVRLAWTEFAQGFYNNAAVTLERAVERDSTSHRAYIYLASTYGQLGRLEDARIAINRANELRALAGWGPYTLASVAELLWVGNQTYFKEGLRKARVPPDADWTKLVKKISTGDAVSQYRIEGAETINLDQAKMLHGQNIPFVDVSKFWERERIPGTHFLMIWFLGDSDFNQVRLERVAKRDQPVVIYSSGLERRAVNAVAKAVSWGFKNLYYFPDGLKKWKSEGYSVER